MENLIKKYDLPALIEVAKDTVEDYSDIKENHEEAYAGENTVNEEKYYPFGYGDRLVKIVNLLMDLDRLMKNESEENSMEIKKTVFGVFTARDYKSADLEMLFHKSEDADKFVSDITKKHGNSIRTQVLELDVK